MGDGFVAIWRDITDRRQREEELQCHKQEFEALVENSPDVISRFDRQCRHLYINPAIEKATGQSPQAFLGKNPLELGAPEALANQ